MVRYFQVAGLCFSLDLPDNHPSADLLHNYDPFELGDSGSPAGMTKESVGHDPESLLFSLSVVPDPPAERGEDFYRAPEESGQPVIGLLRTSDGWQAEFSPMPGIPCCGILSFSRDFRRGVLFTQGSPAARTFAINNSLMLLFAFAGAACSALEMHASVVMHGGRGFLFLGRSGTGKSTHSSLWMKYIEDTELLNDDNPVLRVTDGVVRVYGTPWSGKTPCYKAKDIPVGAIVRLRQAPENRIERLNAVQAYASVLSSCSGFRPFREVTDAQHETLAAVAMGVPCYHLDCLPDEAAARLCNETVDG
jgi:hypothetical protein